MSIFFVFQGKTYREERAGGYVWSPQLNKAGGRNAGYEKMKDIKTGDYILHNENGKIVAISIAKTNCYEADQPRELLVADKDIEWDIEGYRVDTEYYDFDIPLKTDTYREWLCENYRTDSAFTANGRGRQQYMCNLAKDHAMFLLNEAIRLQKDTDIIACLNNAISELYRTDNTMELKSNFNPLTATAAHENTILAAPVLPEGMPAPFDHAWGYLDKPGEMERHRHPKEEVYFFFKGTGFVFVDGEKIPVQPGDVVRIPADALHTVINRQNEELLWAALWWTETK